MPPHPSLNMKPERREALFAAATKEFSTFGFEQASLNRIIGQIGMSKSSFYHYFPNKTALFEQIIYQTFEPFTQTALHFQPQSLTSETFWPEVFRTIESTSEIFAAHPEVFNVGRMFHRNLNEPGSISVEIMEKPIAFITRILEEGKQVGAIRDDLPTSLLLESVIALGMAIDRWALEHTEGYSVQELNAFQARVMDIFQKMLSPAT